MARSPIARREWVVLAVAFGVLLPPPPSARASCQSELCQREYQLGARREESELRRALAADPDDADALRKLLRIVGGRPGRESALARYRTRYRWEPPPDLSHLAAEAEAERGCLAERLVRLEDDPEVWCRVANDLADPAQRLAAMRDRIDERPEEPELVSCLAFELDEQGRRGEAMAQLGAAFAARAETELAMALAAFLDDPAAALAVYEELAARRPDDVEAQRRLLEHLGRIGRDHPERSEERVEAVVRRLLADELTGNEHHTLCSGVGSRFGEAHRDCWEAYYAASFEGEETEEARYRRGSALERLIPAASRARDWPRLSSLLDLVPDEDLPATWAQIVGFTDGDYCPRFVAAFDRGIATSEEWHVRSLVRTLRECGEDARARKLVAAAGLVRADGSDATTTPDAESLRYSSWPSLAGGLPRRRTLAHLAENATPSLLRDLQSWAREEPENVRPWMGLAAVHERAGAADAALAAYAAAAATAPDDLDLQVMLGAAALRLGRPDTVRQVARRLRRDPAALPRHQAEADYLLGRLARREGRWEEASDLLTAYFLRRLEFAGCPVRGCDRALVLHLVETGDRERLAAYLAARQPAIETFLHLPTSSDLAVVCRGKLQSGCPDRHLLDASNLAADCASPRALARLEELAAAMRDDEELRRRLAGLRALRPCTEAEFPDPEPLFPDDELLSLSWSLREVD